MVSRSSEHDYTQLGIGACGHSVLLWPLVSSLGGHNQVVCEDCTREKYGIDSDEQMIWVNLQPPPKKKAAPRVAKPKKPKPLSPFQALMQEEGLF